MPHFLDYAKGPMSLMDVGGHFRFSKPSSAQQLMNALQAVLDSLSQQTAFVDAQGYI